MYTACSNRRAWTDRQRDRHTHKLTDGRYELHYLPRFAVDKYTHPASGKVKVVAPPRQPTNHGFAHRGFFPILIIADMPVFLGIPAIHGLPI